MVRTMRCGKLKGGGEGMMRRQRPGQVGRGYGLEAWGEDGARGETAGRAKGGWKEGGKGACQLCRRRVTSRPTARLPVRILDPFLAPLQCIVCAVSVSLVRGFRRYFRSLVSSVANAVLLYVYVTRRGVDDARRDDAARSRCSVGLIDCFR